MESVKINHHENIIQKELHKYISEPSRVYSTKSGKRLQIISPGILNVFEGPDFKDVAILLDGYLIIGSCEFHKNASDWNSHKHSEDMLYNDVILHIVLNNDTDINQNFETLVVDYTQITEFVTNPSLVFENNTFDIEELQNLALHRLLRKTAEAKKLLNEYGLKQTLTEMTGTYIAKYESKRNRHKYNSERLANLVENISSSYIFDFLNDLQEKNKTNVNDFMIMLLKKQLSDEGAHLRRELIINSFLPIALALANDEARISLFLWYWSTTSLNKYGLLTRKFPETSQNYLWQQQGMLEYIKQYGSKNNIASEMLNEYGFAEVLSFYYLGRLPIELDKN